MARMLYRLRDLDAHEPSFARDGVLTLCALQTVTLRSGDEELLRTGVEVCVGRGMLSLITLSQDLLLKNLTFKPVIARDTFEVCYEVLNDTFEDVVIKEGTPVFTVCAFTPVQSDPVETRRFPEDYGLADALTSATDTALGDLSTW
jgi:hypothetical protein